MKRGAPRLALALASVLSLGFAGSVLAHARPLSYSLWTVGPDDVRVQIQITDFDLALLGFDLAHAPQREAQATAHLQQGLTLEVGGEPCVPVAAPLRAPAQAPWLIWTWSVRCPARGERVVAARFISMLQGAHRHLVRFDDGRGHNADHVLDLARPTAVVGQRARSSFLDYLLMGVEHLLTGWDHIAFLIGLLLLAAGLRDVIMLVTSFTLAHGLTLTVALLGPVHPDPVPVEALIGFSVALLGAENSWLLSGRGRAIPGFVCGGLLLLALAGGAAVTRLSLLGLSLFCASHFAWLRRAQRPAALRIAIAFAFGLIHGFGFAGVMQELDLPRAELWPALLGFNSGVELAQLAVVVLAAPCVQVIGSLQEGRWARLLAEVASAAICGLGLFWFTTRCFA